MLLQRLPNEHRYVMTNSLQYKGLIAQGTNMFDVATSPTTLLYFLPSQSSTHPRTLSPLNTSNLSKTYLTSSATNADFLICRLCPDPSSASLHLLAQFQLLFLPHLLPHTYPNQFPYDLPLPLSPFSSFPVISIH